MIRLLKSSSIVIIVGAGGVGKTTISAALGLAAAQAGVATGIITADPSRRLRDTLGIERLSTKLRRLDSRHLRAAGLDPRLNLAAMALETEAVWDGLVDQFVETPEARRRILENTFYRNLTRRFAGADSAAALVQLIELRKNLRYSLHIVDTPPSGHAFDLIEGPANLARLLDSDSARWLFEWSTTNKRLGITNFVANVVVQQLERFAGMQPLTAIGEFFSSAAEVAGAIAQRMREAEELLRSSSTSLILVTTAESERLREASDIARELRRADLRLAGVVINRVADERTCAALRAHPARVPAHLRDIELLSKKLPNANHGGDGVANLVGFLKQYAVAQRDAIVRSAEFVDQFVQDVEIAAVPQLTPTKDDLKSVAAIGELVANGVYGRGFLRNAAATLKSSTGLQPSRPTKSRSA